MLKTAWLGGLFGAMKDSFSNRGTVAYKDILAIRRRRCQAHSRSLTGPSFTATMASTNPIVTSPAAVAKGAI